MYSTWELALFRETWNKDLVTSCTIKRQAVGSSGMRTGAYAAVGSGVLCRIREGGGRSPHLDTGIGSLTTKVPNSRLIDLAWNADVQVGDQVEVGAVIYEVRRAEKDDPDRIGITAEVEIKKQPE
jgi:hypothetical protein